jgi:predicted PurR-regulated permease PerM
VSANVEAMSWLSFDARAARITWTILAILGGFALIYAMRRAVIVVALSLFFAYLLFPLVRLTQRWLIPTRSLAIAAVYMVILTALGGAGVVIGPRLTTEAQSLAEKLPEMSKPIQSGEIVGNVLRPHGWESREIAEIERLMRTHMGQIIGYAQHAGAGLLKWLAGAWVIVLIPVFAFFILKDVEQLTSATILRLSHRTGWGMWRDIAQDYGTAPLIMGRGIDIHPALVIVGVLAGGELAGVVGMFLSVPVIAAGRIVWRRLQAPVSALVEEPTSRTRAVMQLSLTGDR